MIIVTVAAVVLTLLLCFAVFAYFKIREMDKKIYAAHSALNVQLSFRREIVRNLAALAAAAAPENAGLAALSSKLGAEPDDEFNIPARAAQENLISSDLGGLYKLTAGAGALKTDENFISYKKSVSKSEEKIRQAAAFYNNSARDYNTLISIFPVNLAAKMFDYGPAEFFHFEPVKTEE